MKKALLAMTALVALTNAALADGYNPYQHRHSHVGGGGGDAGIALFGGLVGGLILGGMINNMNQPSYGYAPQARQVCQYRWVQEWDNWSGSYVMVQRPFCQWIQY